MVFNTSLNSSPVLDSAVALEKNFYEIEIYYCYRPDY